MTRSSQTDQHSGRPASLASQRASTLSHHPRQLTAESTGQIPGRAGSVHSKVGEATHRGNAAMRLKLQEAEAAAPQAQTALLHI